MRIYLKASKSLEPVPFNHIHKLVGVVNKWMGLNNKYHGRESLYSFSWLSNSVVSNNNLQFPRGSNFFISAHDDDLIRLIISNIQIDPILFSGLKVLEVQVINGQVFQNGTDKFTVASPVLIKKRNEGRVDHLLFDDLSVDTIMTASLVHKMEIAKIDPAGFSVAFDRTYTSSKTKLVDYKGIKNKASVCPIIVTGNAEQKLFTWNVGVGNSTGIGFGALN